MSADAPDLQDQSRPDRRGAFFLLFFSLMAIGAGNTMLIAAVLPPMTRELGLSDWMAACIFALSAFFWATTSPIWGKKSNTWGRRPIAAMGLIAYGVSMALLFLFGYLALNGVIVGSVLIFFCLALSRSVFGIFSSGTSPAAQAYVADRTSPEERQSEIAFITSGFSVGTVVGPAFAAALVGAFGLLSPVALTSVIALTMGALIWFRLPETKAPVSDAVEVEVENAVPDQAESGLWRSSQVLPFLLFAVTLSLVTGVLTQVFVFSVMDRLNVTGREAAQFTGPAFMVGAMAVLLAQLVLIPRLKMRNKTLMWVGCLPLFCGAVLLIFAADFASLVLSQFLIGLGQGLTRPGFSSGASLAVSPKLQGNVAGLVMSANGMGFIITPFFGLYLYEFVNPQLPFLLCAILIVIMFIFARFILKDGLGEAETAPTH